MMALPNSRRQIPGQSSLPVRSHVTRPVKPLATPLTLATPTKHTARVTPTTTSPTIRVTPKPSPRSLTNPKAQDTPLDPETPINLKIDEKTRSRYDILRRKYDAKRDAERPSRPENREASPSAFFITETEGLPSNDAVSTPCLNTPPLHKTARTRHRDHVISSDPLLSFTPTKRKPNARLACLDPTPTPTPLPLATPLPVSPLGRESPTLQSISKPAPCDRSSYVPPIPVAKRVQLPLQKTKEPQQNNLPPIPQRKLPYPRHVTPRTTKNVSPRANKPTKPMCPPATMNCLIPLPSLAVPVTRKPVVPSSTPVVAVKPILPIPSLANPSASVVPLETSKQPEPRVPALPVTSCSLESRDIISDPQPTRALAINSAYIPNHISTSSDNLENPRRHATAMLVVRRSQPNSVVISTSRYVRRLFQVPGIPGRACVVAGVMTRWTRPRRSPPALLRTHLKRRLHDLWSRAAMKFSVK